MRPSTLLPLMAFRTFANASEVLWGLSTILKSGQATGRLISISTYDRETRLNLRQHPALD